MTHIHIAINGNVEFDGIVDEWAQQAPDMFRDQIKPNATPRPWLKAIMVSVADAVLAQESVIIDATHRSGRWEMKVEYP